MNMVTVCNDETADEYINKDDEKFFFTCFKEIEKEAKGKSGKAINLTISAAAVALASALMTM